MTLYENVGHDTNANQFLKWIIQNQKNEKIFKKYYLVLMLYLSYTVNAQTSSLVDYNLMGTDSNLAFKW